jgi:D-sedoheptulose 7-phosphate isomerase
MKQVIKKQFIEHIEIFNISMNDLISSIEDAAQLCIESINNGGKILLIGNGGSAADAQHIAAELVGRYKAERNAIPAIALTTDSSILTSISNDYGYSNVFARQVEALANKLDVIIAISTSGNSKNVINALKVANQIGCKSIGLTGSTGGKLRETCNVNLIVPSEDTARIQEIHIFIGHTICHLIEGKVKINSKS